MKAFWTWVVTAVKDVYSFCYTEVGVLLGFFKSPSGKFSDKRLIALALVADVALGGIPKTLFELIFQVTKLIVAVILYVIAEVTKS